MAAVYPNLFGLTPLSQGLLDETRLGAGFQPSALPASVETTRRTPPVPEESPPELGDDALVQFTAAAQSLFNREQFDGVPRSVISVEQTLSTLVGSMTANATVALAAAAQTSPQAALALTRF